MAQTKGGETMKSVEEKEKAPAAKIMVFCLILVALAAGIVTEARALTRKWTMYPVSTPNADYGRDVAVAPDGDIYVVGYIPVTGQDQNIFIGKYSPQQEERWTDTINGGADGNDRAYGVAVAPNGNVYLTGYTAEPGEEANIILQKYKPSGKKGWTRTYNGKDNYWDEGRSVAVAPDGSIFVAGFTWVDDEEENVWVRKYSRRGKKRWTKKYSGPAGKSDGAEGVAAGPDGSCYVIGHTDTGDEEEEEYNIWLRKYSPGGKTLWTRTFNGPYSSHDSGYDVAVGKDGSVYAVGETTVYDSGTPDPPYDLIWLRKYSSRGKKRWTVKTGPSLRRNTGWGVTVGPKGAIYVAGHTDDSSQSNNLWLGKYSPKGKERWTEVYNGPGNGSDYGRGVAVAPNGIIYVTGESVVTGLNYDFYLQKYRQ
jgi:uncharacterized delta-60 repeat protein